MQDDRTWRPLRAGLGAPALESLIGDLSQLELTPPNTEDLAARLGEIVTTARRAAEATYATLYLCEEVPAERLQAWEAVRPWALAEGPPALERFACVQHVVEVGRPIQLLRSGVAADPAGGAGSEAQVARESGRPIAVAAVPVMGESGRVMGALSTVCDGSGVDPASLPQGVLPLLEALAAQAAGALANARLSARLREAQFETVFRLSVAAEYRDPDTAAHIQRMSQYSATIARHMGLDAREVELARFASPMHDVGKLGIPDAILMKTGPLTEDEWRVMRLHTRIGTEILGRSDSPIVRASEAVAGTHHEKFGGGGYPLGLRGDRIPTIGRVAALGDAFDAITSRRCYKEALPLEAGLEAAKADAGTHFDPECVAALERAFPEVERVHKLFADAPPLSPCH